jgi:hypothetical protein
MREQLGCLLLIWLLIIQQAQSDTDDTNIDEVKQIGLRHFSLKNKTLGKSYSVKYKFLV